MSHDLLVQMAYFRLLPQGLATELLSYNGYVPRSNDLL